MNNSSTPKKTTEEIVRSLKNFVLDGVRCLKVINIKRTEKVTKELHPKTNQPTNILKTEALSETVKTLEFPLHEATVEDITVRRKANLPTFVLKTNKKLYWAEIHPTLNLLSTSLLGSHKCGKCFKLSPLPDDQGGCEKVRNGSRFLEHYSYISDGYETFGTKLNAFVVAKCSHFNSCPKRKEMSPQEIKAAKDGLKLFTTSEAKNGVSMEFFDNPDLLSY